MTVRILALTTAVLLVACQDATRPSFDFVNGPGSPGNSGLFRFQDEDFFISIHQEAGLITVHGLQNSFADLCAGLGSLDLVDFQLKPHTAGEIQALIENANSSVQIVPLVPPTCAALSAAPVLYRGTASLLNTDNNFTPTGTEGERANSFGWVSLGILDDLTNGGQVRYQEVVRGLVSPAGVFSVASSRLDLSPVQ